MPRAAVKVMKTKRIMSIMALSAKLLLIKMTKDRGRITKMSISLLILNRF